MSSRPTPIELVAALAQTLRLLRELLADLPAESWAAPTGCPGWSVQDTVSHIVGLESDLAGRPDPEVELPDLPHLSDGNRGMEHSVQCRRSRSPASILAEYDEVIPARLAHLNAVVAAPDFDPAVKARGPFGWELPLPNLLPLRVFDAYAHEQDIRRATGRPGNLDCPAMGISLRRSLTGVAYNLAAVAGGQAVAFAVEGWGTYTLDLTGEKPRVTLDDPAAPAPAATLTAGASDLLALLCGRSDADPSAVDVDGDEDLAVTVVTLLAVTP